MSKVYFTSDQHFYHQRVIEYCHRPFLTVDEMNAELVRRHNTIVRPEDTVYHLGDFALARRAVEVFLPKLNGTHILIMGNHDHCHMAHAKNLGKQSRMIQEYHHYGFQEIMASSRMQIAGQEVLMNHMPYVGDTHPSEQRYKEYRLEDRGQWLLHGHIHQHWLKRGKQINVGVDRHDFKPISLERIVEIMQTEGDIL